MSSFASGRASALPFVRKSHRRILSTVSDVRKGNWRNGDLRGTTLHEMLWGPPNGPQNRGTSMVCILQGSAARGGPRVQKNGLFPPLCPKHAPPAQVVGGLPTAMKCTELWVV